MLESKYQRRNGKGGDSARKDAGYLQGREKIRKERSGTRVE